MKKAKLVLLFIASVALSSCGNMDMGNGTYSFNGVHISDGLKSVDCHVISWRDNKEEPGIEVKTKEFGSLWLSEGTYVLFDKICPICGKALAL